MFKPLIFLALFSVSVSFFSKEWNQNIDHTKVIFSAKKFQVKVKGAFTDVKVHTNFNSNDLAHSYVNVKIRVESISTGKKWKDKKILSKKFFNGEKYKFIQLRSSKIEKKENGEVSLFADIKIKDITKKIEIPLQITEEKNNLTIKSSFEINTKDFHIGDSSLGISKTAKIMVEFSGNTP